jgi:uncharacterized protein (TIRG00374 family)
MPPLKKALNKYTIAKVFVAITLMIWLVKSGRLYFSPLLSASLNSIHLVGMGILFLSLSIQGLRWWWLLRTQKIHLSFRKTVSLVWIGQFFSLVLPGIAGGELARGYYITQEVSDAKVAGVSTILLDRVMGLYASLFLGSASFLSIVMLEKQIPSLIYQFGMVNLLLLFGTSLLFLIFWIPSTRRLSLTLVPGRLRLLAERTLANYRLHSQDILLCFVLSLLASCLVFIAFQMAGQVVQTSLNWKQVFLVCPLVFIIGALPLSPGGIGVGETAAFLLFSRFGVETGAAIMLILRVWLVILRIPGGLLYIFRNSDSPISRPSEKFNPSAYKDS